MPTDGGSRQPKAAYAVLGVAGIVVATVFAAVASLASGSAKEDEAGPATQPSVSSPVTTTTTTVAQPTIPAPQNPATGSSTSAKPRTSSSTKATTTTARPGKRPPVGSFTATCNGLACRFDATESSDVDGTIVYYAWTFGREEGGANGANRQTVSHTYKQPAFYNVTLVVMDDDGISDTVTKRVQVSP